MTFLRAATEPSVRRHGLHIRASGVVPAVLSRGRVAVGTDGSYWGQAALGWAARYALMRGAELDVYEADRRFEQLPPDLPADIGTGSILRPYPLLSARVRGSGADSSGALLAAGAESELVVVGCRGQRRRNLGLGSHAMLLASNANCDVVVVRGRPQAVRGEFGKVIAWVDGDERVVARAQELARSFRTPLDVRQHQAGTDAPDGADLLVVAGNAGHTRTALHHATCPVLVVV
jgi:nucleotide-binding universal stress UspA family protein